jgi:hypothetical protein
MSAWAIRVHIRALGCFCQPKTRPLALVGNTGQDMETWIQDGLNGTSLLMKVYAPDAQEGEGPIAEGYELTRPRTAQVGEQTVERTERVLVVRS